MSVCTYGQRSASQSSIYLILLDRNYKTPNQAVATALSGHRPVEHRVAARHHLAVVAESHVKDTLGRKKHFGWRHLERTSPLQREPIYTAGIGGVLDGKWERWCVFFQGVKRADIWSS